MGNQEDIMLNRYIIERNIKGVGAGADKDFANMAEKSNEALSALGPKIQWLQSFVTDDKVYCEYLAENEDLVRQHAKLGGFPADSVAKVTHICDPTTARDDFAELRSKQTTQRDPLQNAS
jgi:hypothetical protein